LGFNSTSQPIAMIVNMIDVAVMNLAAFDVLAIISLCI